MLVVRRLGTCVVSFGVALIYARSVAEPITRNKSDVSAEPLDERLKHSVAL
jgi:hypothetical protein